MLGDGKGPLFGDQGFVTGPSTITDTGTGLVYDIRTSYNIDPTTGDIDPTTGMSTLHSLDLGTLTVPASALTTIPAAKQRRLPGRAYSRSYKSLFFFSMGQNSMALQEYSLGT
ncbi:hypothetical protein BG000_000430 [Podila horticola]|nr:hypothetical protein BG000_000430 [Podila horticola]